MAGHLRFAVLHSEGREREKEREGNGNVEWQGLSLVFKLHFQKFFVFPQIA